MTSKEQKSTDRLKQPPMSYLVSTKLAVGQDTVEQPVFEARRELRCIRCNGEIVVGEHFTKQRSPHSGRQNRKEHPCCQRCYPFEEVTDTRPPVCS
jgi:hypothetical protein